MDARPANRLLLPLNRWSRTMVTTVSLLEMTLASDEVLAIYCDDIVDYYYAWVVPAALLPYFAFKGEWPAKTCKGFRAEVPAGSSRMCAALRTIPMGHLSAVE
eukprot:13010678-Heterocapsa_arctica.AAC.1